MGYAQSIITVMLKILVSQLVLLLFTVATVSARAATSDEPSAQDADCTPAAALAVGAQQMCGGAPIATALLSVRVQAHERTEQALAALGFREAMDLQLLAGKPEAEELMEELKMDGGLSIPDRAKLRLLIGAGISASGGQPRVRIAGGIQVETTADTEHEPHASESCQSAPRMLQEQQAVGSGGMSLDTIAIVLSVLVGAAGYLVQAYTARRAERSLAEQAQELHARELVRQREHEQMLAQVRPSAPVTSKFCEQRLRQADDFADCADGQSS
eukprot:SAG31_NODE_1776_length_7300_cov_10.281905_6_plen_272_part_00